MRIGRSALAAWKQKNLQEERDVSFENLGSSKIILYERCGSGEWKFSYSGSLEYRTVLGSTFISLDNGKDSHTDGGKTLRDALKHQVTDAIEFLTSNRLEIQRLRSSVGIDGLSLDVGVSGTNGFLQNHFFPPELISLAAEYALALEVSIYAS